MKKLYIKTNSPCLESEYEVTRDGKCKLIGSSLPEHRVIHFTDLMMQFSLESVFRGEKDITNMYMVQETPSGYIPMPAFKITEFYFKETNDKIIRNSKRI